MPAAIPTTTYAHYIAIQTASGQQGSADSSSFPVCFNTGSTGGCSPLGIAAYLATAANGGYVQNTATQSGGSGGTEPADAVFSSSLSGTGPYTCSGLIPWETESYDPTTGNWIGHYQLATLHHGSQDTVYLCFDQASVTTQQNAGSYAPSAVWSASFQRVYHFAAGSLVADSTGNYAATNNTATAGSGQIGGGAAFSGSQLMNLSGGGLGSIVSNGSLTASMWINVTGSADTQCVYGDADNGAQNESLEIQILKAGPNLNWVGELHLSGGVVWPTRPGYQFYGAPVYYSEVYDATANKVWVYINGTPTDAGSATAGTLNSGVHMALGQYGEYPYCTFTGLLDEARFASAARSPSWIAAEYNNQKNGSTFLSAGTIH